MNISNNQGDLTSITNINDIDGLIVKQDDRYLVKDNTVLNNLVLSTTTLYPDRRTNGHRHKGQDEIYMLLKVTGKMQLDDKEVVVREGDVILIEDNVFHRVHNTGSADLYFACVFDGGRNH